MSAAVAITHADAPATPMPDCARLSGLRMAEFVSDGFLRFDAIVPDALNRAVLDELAAGRIAGCRYNDDRLGEREYFAASPAYAQVMRLPQVRAIIESIVGPGPDIDHCAVHTVPARHLDAQYWHQDAAIDARTEAFDIQVFYYPHDTPREAGGTLLLPGSHLRFVHEASISRYHNIAGQTPVVCPAGTIMVAHHGLWHCGQPNRTERTRFMIKLRLNPCVRQRGLFSVDPADHETIGGILSRCHPWLGAEHRLEIIQRLRLWRSLTGSAFDRDLWLARFDNRPA